MKANQSDLSITQSIQAHFGTGPKEDWKVSVAMPRFYGPSWAARIKQTPLECSGFTVCDTEVDIHTGAVTAILQLHQTAEGKAIGNLLRGDENPAFSIRTVGSNVGTIGHVEPGPDAGYDKTFLRRFSDVAPKIHPLPETLRYGKGIGTEGKMGCGYRLFHTAKPEHE